ncbi:hypothetical protein A2U01_0077019, partial [Trifolium medium]|nr:hypothetical protein [Trifolium medium]
AWVRVVGFGCEICLGRFSWLFVVRWMVAPLTSLGLFRTDILVLVCLVADEVGSFIYLGGM